MIQTLNEQELVNYLKIQLNNNFPDNIVINNLDFIVNKSMEKVKFNFSNINLSYYSKNGRIFFNHLNADHYTVFLYYCSNIAYKNNDLILASKLFYLNKLLHSFHCMYDTELPDIFIVCHAQGSVLGKAKYSNYLVITQGCTIGANANLEYPELGEYIIMYPNSSILGNSMISNNVISSNNSMVLNTNIDNNSLIVGIYPKVKIKSINEKIFLQFFKENHAKK